MKIRTTVTFIFLCLLFKWSAYQSMAANYYLATYDETVAGAPHDVSVKKIDLENSSIIGTTVLHHGGSLWNGKPIITSFHNHNYFLFALGIGVNAKNSGPGVETTFVYILDDSLNIIRHEEFPESKISYFEQFEGEEGFRFGLESSVDTMEFYPRGIYNFERNFRFRKIRDFNSGIGPQDLPELNGFEYLHKLRNNPHHTFYSVADYGLFYLLNLNDDNTSIVSSMLTSRKFASNIFAYHPERDKIYLFRLNYEQHGKFPEYEKDYGENWIDSHVLIYDPTTFERLDSLSVNDFAPGNYPLGEDGQANVVGDFIVYYFFNDEWMGRFNPAMLFIFDTRTNAATWLRVGWR